MSIFRSEMSVVWSEMSIVRSEMSIVRSEMSIVRSEMSIDWMLLNVPFSNLQSGACCRRPAKCQSFCSVYGLWIGRDLYRATTDVTQDLGFFGLIRRNPHPFIHVAAFYANQSVLGSYIYMNPHEMTRRTMWLLFSNPLIVRNDHHWRWRSANLGPVDIEQGVVSLCHTCCEVWDLEFRFFIQKTVPVVYLRAMVLRTSSWVM